jgi:hypothetical protein
MMKRRGRAVRLGAAALALAALTAADARGAEQIEGEVLDLACYIPKRAKGPAHHKCAETCAEHGMPLGLLTDDASVYLLYPRHGEESSFETVKQLAGRRAKLTGDAAERAGMRGFEVHDAAPAD